MSGKRAAATQPNPCSHESESLTLITPNNCTSSFASHGTHPIFYYYRALNITSHNSCARGFETLFDRSHLTVVSIMHVPLSSVATPWLAYKSMQLSERTKFRWNCPISRFERDNPVGRQARTVPYCVPRRRITDRRQKFKRGFPAIGESWTPDSGQIFSSWQKCWAIALRITASQGMKYATVEFLTMYYVYHQSLKPTF